MLGLGLVLGVILAVPLLVRAIHMGVAQDGPIGLLAVDMPAALGAVFGLREGIVRYRAARLVAAAGCCWHRSACGWRTGSTSAGSVCCCAVALILLMVAWRNGAWYRRAWPAPSKVQRDHFPSTRGDLCVARMLDKAQQPIAIGRVAILADEHHPKRQIEPIKE